MLKNVAGQKVYFSLFKSGARIASPTIAAGDFKRDLDGAGQNNVTTPPTSDAAGLVTWSPSQAETNGDIVTLLGNDAAGAEWEPLTIVFETMGIVLYPTQPAITWAQQTITANVNAQGALHIVNANANGRGIYAEGGQVGAMSLGTAAGSVGQYNQGISIGQQNYGAGAGAYGQANSGAEDGQYNAGTAGYGINALGATSGIRADGTADYGIEATGGTEPVNWLGDIADEVWSEALPATYTAGMAGYILGHWTSVGVLYRSPVVTEERVELFQDDDYFEADDHSLKWTDSGSTWPDCTGATPYLLVRAADGSTFSKAGTILNPGTATQSAYIELTAAESATLVNKPDPSEFRLRVTLASGHKVTLVDGWMNVDLDIG